MKNILDKKSFYSHLFKVIQTDMKKREISTYTLMKNNNYLISYGQYYKIKKASEGDTGHPLSFSRLEKLCDQLKLKVEIQFLVY